MLLLKWYIQVSKPDHLARERVDVHTLVTDLIGESELSFVSTEAALPSATIQKTPEPASSIKTSPSVTPGRSRPVKLVVDQLAPVNIQPKVHVACVYIARHSWHGLAILYRGHLRLILW